MTRLAESLRPSAAHPERLIGPARRLWERQLGMWRDHQRFHVVFWGPPGAGKTTLARMLAESSGLPVTQLSAVRDGVADIRKAAEQNPCALLFIDEIHRLSRSQQDVLLPILEHDQCWVVGATTESPQSVFAPALLSRLRLLRTGAPSESEIAEALRRGAENLNENDVPEGLTHQALMAALGEHEERIIHSSNGDLRLAWNILESLAGVYGQLPPGDERERECLSTFENLQRSYTPAKHYDYASAMIKSMRGSDPDAALYYAMAALDTGEDLIFMLRRCVIFASEDVGNADPQALAVAVNAFHAAKAVGMPEGRIPLAQAVTYLAGTLKSNRCYSAIAQVRAWREQAIGDARETEMAPPAALVLKGAPSYRYPHDHPGAFVDFEYLPPAIAKIRQQEGAAYRPSSDGVEARLSERLAKLWPRHHRKEK